MLLAAGDVVCVSSTSVKLYDTATGKLVWTVPQAEALSLTSEILIVVSHTRDTQSIDGYDRRTRTRKWSYSLSVPSANFTVGKTGHPNELSFASGATASDGTQHLMLSIVNIQDGTLQRTALDINAEASDGTHIYWGDGPWLHVVDAVTLKPQWAFYGAGAAPVIAGSMVIGHGWGNWATAINVETRQAVWEQSVWRDSLHTLLHTSNGHLLILEATNVPTAVAAFAVDADRIAWHYDVLCETFRDSFQAAGAGHYAFVAGSHQHLPDQKEPRGGFYCLDADTGAVRWTYEQPRVQGRSIIISGGCLYGIDEQGNL